MTTPRPLRRRTTGCDWFAMTGITSGKGNGARKGLMAPSLRSLICRRLVALSDPMCTGLPRTSLQCPAEASLGLFGRSQRMLTRFN